MRACRGQDGNVRAGVLWKRNPNFRADGCKAARVFGSGKVFVDVSGVDEILTVEVNTDTNYTKVKMPAYIDIKRFDISGIFDTTGGSESTGAAGSMPEASTAAGAPDNTASDAALKEVKAVDFGGILHLIIPDISAKPRNFETRKEVCI